MYSVSYQKTHLAATHQYQSGYLMSLSTFPIKPYTKLLYLFLTSVSPCVVIYSYIKTNQMHNISNLFYFGTTLYMFRTVFPSIVRSLRLYIQHQVYVIQVVWLIASKQPHNLYDIHLKLYVQPKTPDDGRKDRPKHVECCSKIK